MKKLFIILLFFVVNISKAQTVNPTGMDVTMHGYIFFTGSGLFFQPLDFYQPNKGFVSSLDKLSFKIFEGTDMETYSDVVKAIGNKLAVKNVFDDTIKKNPLLKAYDTITYFKCCVDIAMGFFDSTYCSFSDIGYGFVLNNTFISYGHLSVRNQLLRIIPDDIKVLRQFYTFYTKQKRRPPDWLEKLYSEKTLKRKS